MKRIHLLFLALYLTAVGFSAQCASIAQPLRESVAAVASKSPAVPVTLSGVLDDGEVITARPPIDTVLIEPAEDRIELTLRHSFPRGRGKTLLREVRVDADA